MHFPPPIWLSVLMTGFAGAAAWLLFLFLARRRGGPERLGADYLIVPVIVMTAISTTDTIWMWMISPVAVRLDTGSTGFGHWQVDDFGNGQVEVSVDGVTCRQDYDALDPSRYSQSRFSCPGGVTGVLRIIRDGAGGWLTEGEGVLRLRDGEGNTRYGWYVFGPRARLALLTRGLLGLPEGVADKAAFEQIDETARTIATR